MSTAVAMLQRRAFVARTTLEPANRINAYKVHKALENFDVVRVTVDAARGMDATGEYAMKFTLTVDCDNAAFANDLGAELARILRRMAKNVETDIPDNETRWSLRDINGNTVGKAGIK